MKVALVHDFLTKPGGAEKVLMALSEIYPDAPVYTIVYDKTYTDKDFRGKKIVASSLQKYPYFIRKRLKYLLPKMPSAIEEFDFSNFDAVISSSNSFAHGIITGPKTFHICYCHSPMRYAWDWSNEYLQENRLGFDIKGFVARAIISKIRLWDKIVSDRVDAYIANSVNVKNRIKKYYGLNADVVYPPVDTEKISYGNGQRGYYVISSRIEPYKKIDLAVKVFNKNKIPLYIIGDGSQLEFLKSVAKSNVKFLGWQNPKSVYEYLSRAKAFIFPGEDDFGIAPVEAMAAGIPVVAYKRGGVLETIIDGKTGVFFNEETVSSLFEAVEKLECAYNKIDKQICRDQAEKFSKEKFVENFKKIFETRFSEYKTRIHGKQN